MANASLNSGLDQSAAGLAKQMTDIYSGGFAVGSGWDKAGVGALNVSPRRLVLNGTDADIVVNGASLMLAIVGIQKRLNCLQVNPQLEAEWDQLQALGDQYRVLEQQILDKQATWDRLRDRTTPHID